jgi:hypothetical protein
MLKLRNYKHRSEIKPHNMKKGLKTISKTNGMLKTPETNDYSEQEIGHTNQSLSQTPRKRKLKEIYTSQRARFDSIKNTRHLRKRNVYISSVKHKFYFPSMFTNTPMAVFCQCDIFQIQFCYNMWFLLVIYPPTSVVFNL